MLDIRRLLAIVRAAVLNRNTFAIFGFACAFYLIFYAWPYHNQVIIEIPTAVVDLDRTSVSREWVQRIDATPATKVVSIENDLAVAQRRFQDGQADVIVVLPATLSRDLQRGEPSVINVIGNGAFPVKGRAVGTALTQLAAQESVGLTVRQALQHGLDPIQAKRLAALPPAFVSQDLFNPISGYGLYTVSIVSTIILQAIMLFGTVIVLGGWIKDRTSPFVDGLGRRPSTLITLIGGFWLIALFWGYFLEGFGMAMLGMPSFCDPIATIVATALFTLSITVLGVLLALWMGNNHYAATLCVVASAPSVFLTGMVFPMENAPLWVEIVSWAIPTTPGAAALLGASQEGASLAEIARPLGMLITQIVVYGTIAFRLARRYR